MNPVDLLREPGPDDIAWGYVSDLFGSGPLAEAVAVVCTALVSFGSIMLAWHVLSGTVSSAYSGKVLGERWHQIWAPLRVVAGFGLLIPIGAAAGGSVGLVGLIALVVSPSINLGNATVSAFMAPVIREAQPIATSSVGGRDLAFALLQAETCAAVLNAHHRHGRGASAERVPLPAPAGALLSSGYWSPTTSTVWNYGECGSVTYPLDNEQAAFGEERREATASIVTAIRAEFTATVGEVFARTARLAAPDEDTVRAVWEAEGERAQDILHGLGLWLVGQGREWDASVVEAARKVSVQVGQGQRERILADIEAKGFMASGSYYRALAQTSALTVALASQPATVNGPDLYGSDAQRFESASHLVRQAMRWDTAELSANDLAFAGDATANTFQRFVAPLTRGVGEWLSKRGPSIDPVGDMMAFGHNLLTGAQAAIGVGVVAKTAASSGPGSLLGAGGGLDWAMQWVSWLIMISLLVGSIHAYILPLIPFVMVFMMSLSWMVLVLEAIVAVHLWAFAFIRMDGTEFVDQKQSPGMTILFNIVLRPALSMLVLCGSLLMLPYLLNVLNQLWGTAYYGSQGGHIVGPIGMLVSLIVFTWLQWQICLRLFGLIPTITDRVAAWVGTSSQGYNEGGETAATTGALVALASKPSGGLPSGGGGAKPKPKDDDRDGRGDKPKR